MRLRTTSRLSDTREKTPEGYLVCKDVAIGRCGTMIYGDEAKGFVDHVTGEPITFDGALEVSRDERVVFDPDTLSSFEGKPVTVLHPEEMTGPDNVGQHEVGTVMNVRRGTGTMDDHIVADLYIRRREGIDAIEGGMREVSCGYDATYRQLSHGRATQDTIRGNHVAIVPKGRGGPTCYVRDEIMQTEAERAEVTAKASSWDRLREFLTGEAPAKPTRDAAPTFDEAAFRASLLADVKGIVAEAVRPVADKQASQTATLDAAAIVALETRIGTMLPDLETLKPGIARPGATMDAVMGSQREALTAALAGDHAATIKTVVKGDVATMDAATLDASVAAAAGVQRVLNDVRTTGGVATPVIPAATMDANKDFNAKALAYHGATAGHVVS